jgi:hypothetical protein
MLTSSTGKKKGGASIELDLMIEKVMKRAKEIALQQGLALSPGEQSAQEGVTLCAASCVARAAVELMEGPEALLWFYDKVLVTDKEEFASAIFESCGLRRELASQVQLENDKCPSSSRLSWFLGLEFKPEGGPGCVQGPNESNNLTGNATSGRGAL